MPLVSFFSVLVPSFSGQEFAVHEYCALQPSHCLQNLEVKLQLTDPKRPNAWISLGKLEIDLTNYATIGGFEGWELQARPPFFFNKKKSSALPPVT